jgi:hypothetical protein
MKGNYKGNNFNLDKSSKYQALIAHLQRSGGGGPNSGSAASAHMALPPPPPQGGMFAFTVRTIGSDQEDGAQDDIRLSSTGVDTYLHKQGFENTLHVERAPPYLHLDPRLLMKDQTEMVVERLLTAANQVSGLGRKSRTLFQSRSTTRFMTTISRTSRAP